MTSMSRFSQVAAAGTVAAVVLGGAIAPAQDAEKSASAELKELYEADQADRTWESAPTPEEWKEITVRDEARRDRVLDLIRSSALRSADDYFHAALVLQHAEGSEEIMLAHILATVAGFKGHEEARWLSAASLDRYLHRLGKAQLLGTQYVRASKDAPWSQGGYDSWLPDSIRAEFGVPPLEDQKARVEKLNGGKPGGKR